MTDSEHPTATQAQTPMANIPPIATTLTTTSPTCALSGTPPFTTITTHLNTSPSPLWALVRLYTDFSGGIEIRDLSRKHRRIGGGSTIIADEWDEEALDLEDTQLVRLGPGEVFETRYTICLGSKAGRLRGSDVKMMVEGGNYEVTARKRLWRWMFEEEMGGELSEEERRGMLSEREVVEWGVDCKVEHTAV